MRFRRLALVDTTSLALAVAAALVAALFGAGYWALVVLHVASPALATIGYWLASGWRPGGIERGTGVRPALRFGGYLAASNVVGYLARHLDNVLIGWFWGARPLGLYDRAYRLLLLPLQQINAPLAGVLLPALSRLQHEPDRFARAYLRALSAVALISVPLPALLFVASEEIVAVVLGSQWVEAVPIFRVLAIAALVQTIENTIGWIYTSLGRTRRMFAWNVMAGSVYVTAFAIGLPYGVIGVARAYAVAVVILVIPDFWYATRGSAVRVTAVLAAVAPAAMASIVAGGAAHVVGGLVRDSIPVLASLGVIGTSFVSIYALALVLPPFRRAIAPLREIWSELKKP